MFKRQAKLLCGDRSQKYGCLWEWGIAWQKWYEWSLLGWWKCSFLIWVMVTWMCIHWAAQIRFVYFSACKLHLSIFKRLKGIIKLNHKISLIHGWCLINYSYCYSNLNTCYWHLPSKWKNKLKQIEKGRPVWFEKGNCECNFTNS